VAGSQGLATVPAWACGPGRRDHFEFVSKMRDRGVEVLELVTRLGEVLADPVARGWFWTGRSRTARSARRLRRRQAELSGAPERGCAARRPLGASAAIPSESTDPVNAAFLGSRSPRR
jgi:hypothetical protein